MQVLPQTHRIVNQLYHIKLSNFKPHRVWDSLAANTEALKSQSIKTHMELKDDISDVGFFFFITHILCPLSYLWAQKYFQLQLLLGGNRLLLLLKVVFLLLILDIYVHLDVTMKSYMLEYCINTVDTVDHGFVVSQGYQNLKFLKLFV